jgi:hypothetical protein
MQNTSFIHADIFFFISTIALVVISIGLIIALVYGIKILRNVREFTDVAKEEGYDLLRDLRDVRSALREEGVKWKNIMDFIRSFFTRKAEKPAKKPRTNKKSKLDVIIEDEASDGVL